MKKNLIRNSFFVIMAVVFCNLSVAEELSVSEDEIELPEVTSVISGDALSAGKEAVPDYNKVIPSSSSASVPIPVLPDVKSPAENNNISSSSANAEKDVYAEGAAGGGFPGYFTGDFSIYRERGNKPFRIRFSHENENGFASKNASDGYFERATAVGFAQSFIGKSSKADFAASYDTANDGLQSKSVSFYDMTRHTLLGNAGASWNLLNGFNISAGINGGWYNRYGGVPKNAVDATETENGAMITDVSPSLSFGWTKKSFNINLLAEYENQNNFGEDEALVKAKGSTSAQSSHRGDFSLNAKWENNNSKVYGSAGIVCGTAIGDPVIVIPWKIGTEFSFVSSASPRPVTFSAEGGVNSFQSEYRELEKLFRYSVLQCIPTETTDWYGNIHASIPVKNFFSLKGDVSYKKTAFGNGVWEPLYDEDVSSTGLYFYEKTDRTQFDSNAGIETSVGIFTLGASWKSYWIHVPSACDSQNLLFSAMIQSTDAKWNVETTCRLALGDDSDSVPDISGNASVRLSPSIRLAVEVDDVVKLITNKTRSYAATNYCEKSGCAALKIKFQF